MNDPQDEKPVPPSSPAEQRSLLFRRLAVLIAVAAIALLGYFGQPYLKLLGPPERCWEIQEVDGRLYKVNPCTGQFKLIGDVREPADKP
jgi:hypothetical protein